MGDPWTPASGARGSTRACWVEEAHNQGAWGGPGDLCVEALVWCRERWEARLYLHKVWGAVWLRRLMWHEAGWCCMAGEAHAIHEGPMQYGRGGGHAVPCAVPMACGWQDCGPQTLKSPIVLVYNTEGNAFERALGNGSYSQTTTPRIYASWNLSML